MNNAYISLRLNKLKNYLAIKTGMVNHQKVLHEVTTSAKHTWIYYLMLLLSSLIALFGLLTNSVAVVIGAMLISPLMGPIISIGLSLTTNDLPLLRREFQTIVFSVILVVLVTAIVAVISPLKEQTAEIMARVRPNIYDLFIAAFSGVAGAVALCTNRNYLMTATGVAVATAVIPPLSVVGYGVGTGQIMLALGGFLLFFTNFVAIVLISNLVFFIMGFRTSHMEAVQHSRRKRLLVVAGVLVFISLPLIYTLIVDLRKVKTNKLIEQVLKKRLNQEQVSRLINYAQMTRDGKLKIRATVNTVSFINKERLQQIEKELKGVMETPVDFQLEQLIVASEKIPVQREQPAILPVATSKPQPETPGDIAAKVRGMVAKVENEIAESLAPFRLSETRLSFSGIDAPLNIVASLRRDYALSDDEKLILSRQLEHDLGLPVNLNIAVIPLLPPIRFANDGNLAPESIKELGIIKELPGGADKFRYVIEVPDRKYLKKASLLRKHLTQELKVSNLLQSQKIVPGRSEVALRVLR